MITKDSGLDLFRKPERECEMCERKAPNCPGGSLTMAASGVPPRRVWLCADCIDCGSSDPYADPYKSERAVRGFPAIAGPTTEEDRAIIRRALDVIEKWDAWDVATINRDVIRLCHSCNDLRAALTAAGYLPEDSSIERTEK